MEIERIKKKTENILKNREEVSDIDIGVLLRDNYEADPLYEAKISIESDKSLGIETEARILNNKNIIFLHQVLKHGVLLFSRNERERIKFETDTYSRYLDFKPFYEEYNKIRRRSLA